jgi:hypothetical protein
VTNASVNLGAAAEAPVEGKAAPPAAAPVAGTGKASVAAPASGGKLEAKAPVVAARPTASAGSGSLIQLGAFPDQQGADAAWARLSKRFAYLAPLGKSIERGEKDGRPVYRLRVNAGSNGQAKELCKKIQAAKESCYVAN